jgi:hypothetical protein
MKLLNVKELVSTEDSDKLVCSGHFEYGLLSRMPGLANH